MHNRNHLLYENPQDRDYSRSFFLINSNFAHPKLPSGHILLIMSIV